MFWWWSVKVPAYLGKKAASDLPQTYWGTNQLATQSGEGLELVFEELGGFR